MRLLHVVSSPRGADSVSRAVTEAVVAACREAHPDLDVDTLDVWAADLPEFDPRTVDVEYKLVSGEELDDHQLDFLRLWLQIIGVRDVRTLRVEHTWDDLVPHTLAAGIEQARALVADFSSLRRSWRGGRAVRRRASGTAGYGSASPP